MNSPLLIESLAHGGNGVGRWQGKAVFVPLSLPGDQVRWRPLREKKRYIEAELVAVEQPGPGRIEPRCPYFGQCGGCQWQHLEYVQQLRWKQQLLEDALVRHARIESPPLQPIVASPQPWQYRNRIQLKCYKAASGPVLGFYRRGSHYVIDVESCPIAYPRLNEGLKLARQILQSAPAPATIPQFDLAVGDDDTLQLICHQLGNAAADWCASMVRQAEAAGVALLLQQGRKSTLTTLAGTANLRLRVDDPPLWLEAPPGGFAQINSEQNRRLVEAVLQLADLSGGERLLDVYCGMGNFSLPLARRAAEVVGVEGYAPAIGQARLNAAGNGLTNVRFHAADAAEFMAAQGEPFDLVVLDPPRTGADREVVRSLLRLAPPRIIYVSCDPITLARDLSILLNNGYRLQSSQAFDLFPQTYHLESVSLLVRE